MAGLLADTCSVMSLPIQVYNHNNQMVHIPDMIKIKRMRGDQILEVRFRYLLEIVLVPFDVSLN